MRAKKLSLQLGRKKEKGKDIRHLLGDQYRAQSREKLQKIYKTRTGQLFKNQNAP